MPVRKDSVLYNCRVILYNKKIVLIRPKTKLAGNGNYRESRWFTEWQSDKSCYFKLPSEIENVTEQKFVPFGSDVVIEVTTKGNSNSLRIGFEICEELWRPDASHIKLFLERGCHLICNSSASYWEIRKLDRAFTLMQSATLKSGGCYAFSNLIGCDGGRLCFYGRSHLTLNGNLLARTSGQDDFLEEVQLAIADIDVLEIEGYRAQNYIRASPHTATGSILYFNDGYCDHVTINSSLNSLTIYLQLHEKSTELPIINTRNSSLNVKLKPEEELAHYGSLWLWDYLRRCKGMGGFIIPLSGGIDSSSVACLVYKMSQMIFNRINRTKMIEFTSDDAVAKLLQVTNYNSFQLKYKSVQDICGKILRCVYLGTKYSGESSKSRAEKLSQLIGAEFLSLNYNNVYETILNTSIDGKTVETSDNVSLREQNLQARLRMVHTYFFAENRLVLSTGNVDEALVGYLTKYDCSAGDLNPIGSISKQDLRQFMKFFEESMGKETVVTEIINAIPSAELTGEDQSDEADLGLTYEELSLFGRYRRGEFGSFGPYLTFCRMWNEKCSHHLNDPSLLATKVKRFFSLHARNRHKQTVLTPSLHSESYSPDDNRFDHRQFLFDTTWSWQFKQIDEKLKLILQQQAE